MASDATILAAIDSLIRPSLLRVRHRPMARSMAAEINPILRERHKNTAGRRVMNFVVAVTLLITIKNEARHSPSPTAS